MLKIINTEELDNICEMIQSDDREMRKLATTLLRKERKIQFSMSAVLLLHVLFTYFHLCIITYLIINGAKWYSIPLIIGFIMQIFFSIFSISASLIKRERTKDAMVTVLTD